MTKPYCNVETSLREFEAAHKTYMGLSIFTEAGKEAKRMMLEARDKHSKAVQAAHQNWIVM